MAPEGLPPKSLTAPKSDATTESPLSEGLESMRNTLVPCLLWGSGLGFRLLKAVFQEWSDKINGWRARAPKQDVSGRNGVVAPTDSRGFHSLQSPKTMVLRRDSWNLSGVAILLGIDVQQIVHECSPEAQSAL